MTRKVYEYRAIAKGTLSRPYRFFKEGQIITSFEPLDHPALVDASTPVKQPSKVIVPYMVINGRAQRPDYADNAPTLSNELPQKGVPPIKDPVYDRSMDSLKRLEATLDGKPAEAPAAPEAPAVSPDADFAGGTGNQDVLGG